MILAILAVQLALPLVLLAWLAFLPGRSIVGFALQAVGIAAFLFALARVSQWAVPAWWLPFVHGALWLAAIIAFLVRVRLPSCRAKQLRRCFPFEAGAVTRSDAALFQREEMQPAIVEERAH